jgi:glutamyl-tRNA reductase
VMSRLAHLSQQDRELVEGMASSIVNKLIHRTMVTLKAEVNSSNGPAFVEAARRFFHLDQSSTHSSEEEDRESRLRYLSPDPVESAHEEPAAPVRKRAG